MKLTSHRAPVQLAWEQHEVLKKESREVLEHAG